MRYPMITALFWLFLTVSFSHADEIFLEDYLLHFDYQERADMKMDSKGLIPLLKAGKVQVVDIRFKEEVAAWSFGFALAIPLNELPKRLNELPKDKLIVTACPHKDRAVIAMTYLATKGYNVRYLSDGLVNLAENLRGDKARELIESMAPAGSPPASP